MNVNAQSETLSWIHGIEDELKQTQNELKTWFDREPALLAYNPDEGWNVPQILEHVSLTQHYLLILIRKGRAKAIELAAKPGKLEAAFSEFRPDAARLDAIADPGAFEWIRPEHMEPTGTADLAEVSEKLDAQFAECRQVLSDLGRGEGLLYLTTMTVNGLGKLNVYEYVLFLCRHAQRHLEQLRKVEQEYRQAQK